ncbi:MAG: HEPN domain-containing protein [Kiritimatiellae bacterium]|nr:HEPN domain-containing protein [Kiritimatiellia bacterium]
MTREEKVQYWLDIVADDLDLAEFLCQSGRWLYAAFMCHQVIEKGGVRETTECLVEGTCSRHTGRPHATMCRLTSTSTSGWPNCADSTRR